jgi:hypothetical protein
MTVAQACSRPRADMRTGLWRDGDARTAFAGRVSWIGVPGAIVIGSGIAALQLSPGAIGLELLGNAAATGAGLFAIILMFGPVSGAHFNPVVSPVEANFGRPRSASRPTPPAPRTCSPS